MRILHEKLLCGRKEILEIVFDWIVQQVNSTMNILFFILGFSFAKAKWSSKLDQKCVCGLLWGTR